MFRGNDVTVSVGSSASRSPRWIGYRAGLVWCLTNTLMNLRVLLAPRILSPSTRLRTGVAKRSRRAAALLFLAWGTPLGGDRRSPLQVIAPCRQPKCPRIFITVFVRHHTRSSTRHRGGARGRPPPVSQSVSAAVRVAEYRWCPEGRPRRRPDRAPGHGRPSTATLPRARTTRLRLPGVLPRVPGRKRLASRRNAGFRKVVPQVMGSGNGSERPLGVPDRGLRLLCCLCLQDFRQLP